MEGVGGLSKCSFDVRISKIPVLLDTEECLGGGGGMSSAEGVLSKLGFRGKLVVEVVVVVAKSFSTLNLAPADGPREEDKASARSEAALLTRPGDRCLSAMFLAYRAMRLQTKQD